MPLRKLSLNWNAAQRHQTMSRMAPAHAATHPLDEFQQFEEYLDRMTGRIYSDIMLEWEWRKR